MRLSVYALMRLCANDPFISFQSLLITIYHY